MIIIVIVIITIKKKLINNKNNLITVLIHLKILNQKINPQITKINHFIAMKHNKFPCQFTLAKFQ